MYPQVRTLKGFGLFVELKSKPASGGLRRLFQLAEAGAIRPPVHERCGSETLNDTLASGRSKKLVLDIGIADGPTGN